MRQLQVLVNKLQELITLHKKYNCKLALSEFEKVEFHTLEHPFVFLYPLVARLRIIYTVFPVLSPGKYDHHSVPDVWQGLGTRADPLSPWEVCESLHAGTQFARGRASFALYRGDIFFNFLSIHFLVCDCVLIDMCEGQEQHRRLSSLLPPHGSWASYSGSKCLYLFLNSVQHLII